MAAPRYSRLAIALHWAIALLILANLVLGFVAHELLEPATDRAQGQRLNGLHQSLGLSILLLTLLRMGVRLAAGVPPLPAHMTPTERALASLTHRGFYVLMLGIPLAGWAMVSATPAAPPSRWFGLFPWPRLPLPPSEQLAAAAGEAHGLLAWAAILLVALHVAGALKHHFLDRDDVLARMLPFRAWRG